MITRTCQPELGDSSASVLLILIAQSHLAPSEHSKTANATDVTKIQCLELILNQGVQASQHAGKSLGKAVTDTRAKLGASQST